MTQRVVAAGAERMSRSKGRSGESVLGDLVADAQRAAFPGAQVAFTNKGGLRADLPEGPLVWGDLFAVQPFGNTLVAMTLTGAELLRLLEEQWERTEPELLEVSGLSYGFSASASGGAKVREVRVGGVPLDKKGRYRVVVNSFLASGGNGFTVLAGGSDRATGVDDLEALVGYLRAQPQPVTPPPGDRIRALP
jgi:5'-nucleotidase